MSRKLTTLGTAVLILFVNAAASNVDAIEPDPKSPPAVWWDPLGLFRNSTNPIVRRKVDGVRPTYEGSSFHNSDGRIGTYYEGDGPGIQVDYSYDRIVDQP